MFIRLNNKKVIFFFIALFLRLTLPPQAAVAQEIKDFSVNVSPTSGYSDETFTLRVTIDGVQDAPYPTLVGGEDFTIESIGPSSNVSIINGRMSASLSYLYSMVPNKSGTLSAPSAQIEYQGKKYSANGPLIKVIKSERKSAELKDIIFAEQRLSKNSVWQGEQVLNTLELYSLVPVVDGRLGAVTFEGFWKKTFNNQTNSTRLMNGKKYKVTRIPTYLFPLEAGELTIPEQTIDVKARFPTQGRSRSRQGFFWDPFDSSLFDDFFGGSTKRVKLTAPELALTVRKLPERPANFNGWNLLNTIVGETTVTVEDLPETIELGQNVTVSVVLRSSGNLSPIKQPPLSSNADYRIYYEDPSEEYSEVGGQLISKKVMKFSLVPIQAGTIRLDNLDLGYFDPRRGEYRVAKVRPIEIRVEGGAMPPTTPSDDAQVKEQLVYEKYKEPGALDQVARLVSPAMLLYLFSALCIAGVLAMKLAGFLRAKSAVRKRSSALAKASTPEELKDALIDFLTFSFGIVATAGVRSDLSQLRKLLGEKIVDTNFRYRVDTLLDRLEFLLYGNRKDFERDFATLQREALELAENL